MFLLLLIVCAKFLNGNNSNTHSSLPTQLQSLKSPTTNQHLQQSLPTITKSEDNYFIYYMRQLPTTTFGTPQEILHKLWGVIKTKACPLVNSYFCILQDPSSERRITELESLVSEQEKQMQEYRNVLSITVSCLFS